MKKILTIVCLVCAASLTKADLIADWNFNNGTYATSDHGSGSLALALASSSDASVGGTGTSVNEYSGPPKDSAGTEFVIGSGVKGGLSDYPENGKSTVFTFSMTGFQNLILTYATYRTSTGFTSQNWSYAINGGGYTSFDTIIGMNSDYTKTGIETVDFSSIAALDNVSSVSIELTLTGSTGGSDHFDNIQFNADSMTMTPVPEPAAWGAVSGLGLIGICGLRTWRQRRSGIHITTA